MEREVLHFNGINGDTGEYDIPPLSGEEFSRLIQGEAPAENLQELRFRYQQRVSAHLGVVEGVDPNDLSQSGWGLILPYDAEPAILDALTPLLDLRRSQAGDYFRIYNQESGYRPGESKNDFLARHGAGPGPANPEKVPYHLLIAGNPEKIPFSFQTQLDVQYSVGRIHFETLQEYNNYANSVAAAETSKIKLKRQAAFFGVANQDDEATHMSSRELVAPLVDSLHASREDWVFNAIMGEEARKARLGDLLGKEAPALLFTASHGMSFSNGSQRQLSHQGALLCQDWPGPMEWGRQPINPEFYYSGDDLSSDVSLLGMLAFFFACYGGGTPQLDQFSKQAFRDRAAIAPYPFLAQLPVKMLGLARGGALAVVGHIERAWGYSFKWTGESRQAEAFDSAMKALLSGKTIGAAMEYFNERYAEISTVLSDELEEIEFGKRYDPYELARMWTANNDARGYAILGDPAVRLPVVSADEPVIERSVVTIHSAPPDQIIDTPKISESITEESPTMAEPIPDEGSAPPSGEAAIPAVPEEKSFSFSGSPASKFGFGDKFSNMATDVRNFGEQLMKLLAEAVDSSATIEISTYLGSGDEQNLMATTRLAINGDSQTVLHAKPEELDPNLVALHSQLVLQARAGQAEMFKAMSDAITGLVQQTK